MAGGFTPRRRIEDILTAEGTILQIGTVAIDGSSHAGEILVSRKVIGNGTNGTIVFEGTYDGEPVAVKRLVRGQRAVDFDELYPSCFSRVSAT